MKNLLVAMSFMMTLSSAWAMEGSGPDVSRCVANAINKSIYGKLKEKASSLSTTTSAHQIHRMTYIEMDWGAREEVTTVKKNVSLKKLNFLLTEEEIIHGHSVVHTSSMKDHYREVRESLHVKKVNFELATVADGKLESVSCELMNVKIRSEATKAILLKSE